MLKRYTGFSKTLAGVSRLFSSAKFAPALPGSKNLDWNSLGFSYVQTNCYVRLDHTEGKWQPQPHIVQEPTINLHINSNALHYGQAIFEGLKAFHCKDGKVRVFASSENSARMNRGAERLAMPPVPTELFNSMVDEAVRRNLEFVPPYGTGGSLYIRPMLFGHGPQLGLGAAPQYTFAVVTVPVGSYYKTGLKAVDGLVIEGYDRAAPQGIGAVKAAANYVADVKPAGDAVRKGYTIALYLDAREHKYIEEFSTSNFIAIDSRGVFVTPESPSVLASVTNKVLQQLAKDMGIKVEKRPVPFEEVASFKEVAACGTAVVLTPIKSLTRGGKVYKFGELDILKQLYEKVRAVQVGEAPDVHGWQRVVE